MCRMCRILASGLVALFLTVTSQTCLSQKIERLSAVECYNLGVSAAKRHDHETAIRYLKAAIVQNPRMASAYCDRGAVFSEMGKIDKALDDLERAIKIDPTLVSAYYNRAFTYHKNRDYRKAITDYCATIRLAPKDSMAHANRGAAYAELGDYDKAMSDYNEAIRLVTVP